MWFTVNAQDSQPLQQVSLAEILRLRRGSTPTASYGPTHYAFRNPTVFFYPTPGAADTLNLAYVPAPTEMTTGAHDSSNATYGGIPEDYSPLIELYACWHLASGEDDQSSGQGERYHKWYQEGVTEAKQELLRKGGHRRGPFRLKKQNLIPRDPAVPIY